MKLLYKCSFCTPISIYIHVSIYILYIRCFFIVFGKSIPTTDILNCRFPTFRHRFGFTSWRLKPMHLGDPAMGSPWLAGFGAEFWGWKLGALDAPLQITPGLTPNMSSMEIHHELKLFQSPIRKNGWVFQPAMLAKPGGVGFFLKPSIWKKPWWNRHFCVIDPSVLRDVSSNDLTSGARSDW